MDTVADRSSFFAKSFQQVEPLAIVLGYSQAELQVLLNKMILLNLNFLRQKTNEKDILNKTKSVKETGRSSFEYFSDEESLSFRDVFREEWMGPLIQAKTGIADTTFEELHHQGFKPIHFVCTNTSTGKAEVFSYKTRPDAIVSDALCISMSMFLSSTHSLHIKKNGERIAHPNNVRYIDAEQSYYLHNKYAPVNDYFKKFPNFSYEKTPLDSAIEKEQKQLVLSLVAQGMYVCQDPHKVRYLLKEYAECDNRNIHGVLSHFEAFHEKNSQSHHSVSHLSFFSSESKKSTFEAKERQLEDVMRESLKSLSLEEAANRVAVEEMNQGWIFKKNSCRR